MDTQHANRDTDVASAGRIIDAQPDLDDEEETP
jgi:hypothetical protein